MTAKELARIAADSLVRGERESATTYEKILLRSDDAPEWVRDLCMAACDSDFGDMDWNYEFISDALDELSETDEDEWDELYMDADDRYPYTRSQLNWLACSLNTLAACDKAAEEYAAEPGSISNIITCGMSYVMYQVLDRVRDFLRDKAEEMADSAEGETD
jgi:hypothetical protein